VGHDGSRSHGAILVTMVCICCVNYWKGENANFDVRLVGMPAESSLAICSMIFGGVFERYPKLKVHLPPYSPSPSQQTNNQLTTHERTIAVIKMSRHGRIGYRWRLRTAAARFRARSGASSTAGAVDPTSPRTDAFYLLLTRCVCDLFLLVSFLLCASFCFVALITRRIRANISESFGSIHW
jgi:hypothetical protein